MTFASLTEPAFEIVVNGNNDHVVGALSYNGNYLGSCYFNSSNSCVIVPTENLDSYTEVTLTVTGYNKTPFITQISIGSACAGYSSGDVNADSLVNVADVVISVGIVLGTVSSDECQMEYGDLNQDNEIDILDIIISISIIIEEIQASEYQGIAADINQDGMINVQDIILMINSILD